MREGVTYSANCVFYTADSDTAKFLAESVTRIIIQNLLFHYT